MDLLVALIGVAALFWLALSFRTPRSSPPVEARIRDVSDVIRALVASGVDGGFAAFCPEPTHGPGASGEVINLQVSLEEGRLGMDWVLLAPRNVEARHEVRRFIEDRGHLVREVEMNDVEYLRTEDGDLAALTRAVLAELFLVPPDEPIELAFDGFEWPPQEVGEKPEQQAS